MKHFRQKYLENKEQEELTILDLGSQDVNGSYKNIFNVETWKYIGTDAEVGNNVDIILPNPYNWQQVKSNSIDIVISGQAFEHIEFFWITILEISRVLKVNGMCCIIAPSSGPEHRYPVDCWRFYPDGFSAIARFACLEILESKTQWIDQGYKDGSDTWHDSILIAQKANLGVLRMIKRNIGQKLMHWAFRLLLSAS